MPDLALVTGELHKAWFLGEDEVQLVEKLNEKANEIGDDTGGRTSNGKLQDFTSVINFMPAFVLPWQLVQQRR